MRRLVLVSASCLVLCATGAQAETYEILAGTLTTLEGGATHALTGAFDASVFEGGSPALGQTLLVDDFAMEAGDRSFTPNGPIEFDGLTPFLFLEVADHLAFLGDKVGLFRLRSGGEIVAATDLEVTFRFLDFRSDLSSGGRAIGRLGDSELPRRLELEGTLVEVDQAFAILRGPCIPSPLPPLPPGGGVIVIGDGGNLTIEHVGFDLDPLEPIVFAPPVGGGAVLSRVTGGGNASISVIEGELRIGGEVTLVNPVALVLASIEPATTPTLEELGITAPDGASVSYDDITGELTVVGVGDLLVDGTAIDLPGLTQVTLSAPGTITIRGLLTVPPGVVLRIEAEHIVVEGEIDAPGGVVIPPPDIVPVPFCEGLRPIFQPLERVVGHFSLVASAARQIDIDVHPRRRHNRVRPWRREGIPVAVLGSDDLDVRDIDPTSLRLGRGEAEPVPRHGHRLTRRVRANHDRYPDLLMRFDVQDTDIAIGDTEICLVAETRDGETLEGCDAIQTLPRWLRGRQRGRHHRHSH